MSETPYDFSEDARVAVFQARHEALALGAAELLPSHLALGVLRTLSRFQRAACFDQPQAFDRLCHALGGGPQPAPLIPEDIVYSDDAKAVMAGALRAAAAEGPGTAVAPFHILLGIHGPCDLADQTPRLPSGASAILAAAGLDAHQVRVHLGWPPPRAG